jgi:group I intron endonuclease
MTTNCKTVGIYKILSPTEGVYIGQSWEIEKRRKKYSLGSCKNQNIIYNSIKCHGWAAHTFEVVHELPQDTTQDVMNNYETLYWQLHIDCGCEMMNIREPGSMGKCSEESKIKMRKPRSEEGKNNMRGIKRLNKKPLTQEQKDKISKSNINAWKSRLVPIFCNETNVTYTCVKEASNKLGVGKSTILRILNIPSYKAKCGYTFSYPNKTI